MPGQDDNINLSPKEMAELVGAEDKRSGVEFHYSPEITKRIIDSAKKMKVVEIIAPDSPFIEAWEMRMDGETTTLYTANHNGNYPLCNDGSVYFGLSEEMSIVCQLNGKPCDPKSKTSEHWLMRQVKPVCGAWNIYDNNMQKIYGPFADAEEGEEFARESNFFVEGVWISR